MKPHRDPARFGAEKSAIGHVFGAGYFGILSLLGVSAMSGDRWGRKAGSIGSIIVYTIPAL